MRLPGPGQVRGNSPCPWRLAVKVVLLVALWEHYGASVRREHVPVSLVRQPQASVTPTAPALYMVVCCKQSSLAMTIYLLLLFIFWDHGNQKGCGYT